MGWSTFRGYNIWSLANHFLEEQMKDYCRNKDKVDVNYFYKTSIVH